MWGQGSKLGGGWGGGRIKKGKEKKNYKGLWPTKDHDTTYLRPIIRDNTKKKKRGWGTGAKKRTKNRKGEQKEKQNKPKKNKKKFSTPRLTKGRTSHMGEIGTPKKTQNTHKKTEKKKKKDHKTQSKKRKKKTTRGKKKIKKVVGKGWCVQPPQYALGTRQKPDIERWVQVANLGKTKKKHHHL